MRPINVKKLQKLDYMTPCINSEAIVEYNRAHRDILGKNPCY